MDHGKYKFQFLLPPEVIVGYLFDSASTINMYTMLALRRTHSFYITSDSQIFNKTQSEAKSSIM